MGKSADETSPVRPNHTDRIRQEIRFTEAEITDTLQTIEKRFAPAHIKAEAKVKMKEYSLMGFYKVTDAIRKKPVPAALIGAGALYLIFRKKKKPAHAGKYELPGSAMRELLPKKARKDPVKEVKHYINMFRMAIAVGTAARAVYLQAKAAQKEAPKPHRAGGPVIEAPRAGAFPETVRENVY